ncbi:MAG: DUF4115 domain-containing protein [Sedimenticola sp.]|nr:DUF4115 domain-containing protein [Sedimenticola sp.]
MNAADQNQEEQMPVIEGPGKQLRDIRMAKEMDINRVASLLHLNVPLLKALEADNFSELPGTVFVQGYLKNYARLLDTPAEPILDAFRQFRPQGEEKMDLKAAKVKHEVRSSHTVVRFFTWLIVLGILALVITWWRGYLQWPLDLGLESNSSISESLSDGAAQSEVQSGQLNGSMPLPALLGKPEILDAPIAESSEADKRADDEASSIASSEAAASDPVPSEGGAAASPEVSDQLSPASETPVVAESSTEEGPASDTSVVPENQIEVFFSAACWADITDASGEFRLAGNRGADEHFILGGKPPYKMVFGNAAAVKVTVNGKTYDLTPFTRGNVARLTLDPR